MSHTIRDRGNRPVLCIPVPNNPDIAYRAVLADDLTTIAFIGSAQGGAVYRCAQPACAAHGYAAFATDAAASAWAHWATTHARAIIPEPTYTHAPLPRRLQHQGDLPRVDLRRGAHR